MNVSRKKTDRSVPWLEKGLGILTEHGPAHLSIDALSASMGKTKGAYYHHFRDREDYIVKLMRYYTKKTTEEIIKKTVPGAGPEEELKILLEKVLESPGRTELAIRAWALYEPSVKKFQDKIDFDRIRHLERQLFRVHNDRDRAYSTALRLYSTYLGFQQLKDKASSAIMKKLIRDLFLKI